MRPIEPRTGPAVLPRGHRTRPVLGAVTTLALAGLGTATVLFADLSDLGGGAWVVRGVVLVISLLLAGLGVAAAALVLVGGHRVPRWRVDGDGIALWHVSGSAEVPWDDVVAVGIGYEKAPRLSGARIRQDVAVEVFVRSADPATAYPRAERLVWTEPPPRPDLPEHRLRMLVVETHVELSLGDAVRAVRPDAWIGPYQREWNVLPGV